MYIKKKNKKIKIEISAFRKIQKWKINLKFQERKNWNLFDIIKIENNIIMIIIN